MIQIPSTITLLHFDEPAGVLPSDATGNLEDLAPDAGSNAPAVVSAFTGFGRAFTQAGTTALVTHDVGDPGTVLLRDVSIEALLSLTLTGAAGAQTVICRGLSDGSASEAVCWGLELAEQVGHAGYVEVRMFWEDNAGARHVAPPGVYQHPGDGAEIHLVATRRWETSNRVVCRYYVGGEMIAEVVSTAGDISGGTTGHTTVGGRKHLGAWTGFFQGTLDELRVTDYELSPDEVRQTWDRLTVHQPNGVVMFAGLSPVGSWWYADPSNAIGRFVRVIGQGIGYTISSIEELRTMWLADRAPLATIGRWEDVCGIIPRPHDSLDRRRSRVLAFLAREAGFAIPAIQELFSDLLDLRPADVQVLEFTNEIVDGFTTLEPEWWQVGPDVTWAAAGGVLTVAKPLGADLRWYPGGAVANIRMPLPAVDGYQFCSVKLVSFWAGLPLNAFVGLWMQDRITRDAVWFGVQDVAGVRKLGWRTQVGDVLGAFTAVLDPMPDQAVWLRLETSRTGFSGGVNYPSYDLSWSVTGPSTGFTKTTIGYGAHVPAWAGIAVTCTDAATATALAAAFDDFKAFSWNGLRPFEWFLYRDPALPGTPDLAGAQALALRARPAHTLAGVCSSKSVLCDDPVYGLCDHGPCGAL